MSDAFPLFVVYRTSELLLEYDRYQATRSLVDDSTQSLL